MVIIPFNRENEYMFITTPEILWFDLPTGSFL